MTWAQLAAALTALVTIWVVALPAAADNAPPITNYDIAVTLTPEGVAEVTIDLRVDFASVDGHGIMFTLPRRQQDGSGGHYLFDTTLAGRRIRS